MPEIGYATMPVIPTFKGIEGQLQRGTSKGLADAGTKGGRLFNRGYSNELEQGTGKASTRAGRKGGELFARAYAGPLKAIGGAALGFFAVSKATDFFKDAFAEARESQKVGALTTQVIKTTGAAAKVSAKQVGELSTAISNKTGIDDEAIQRGANMVLTFKNIRNEAGKGNKIFDRTTQAVTDMAAAMGGGSGGEIDLKAASIQVGKALQDPVKGVTALSKVGVTFSSQQKAITKALVEGGTANALIAMGLVDSTTTFNNLIKQQHGDVAKTVDLLTNQLTPAQKRLYEHYTEGGHTLEAQRDILKELNSEFGGAAAAQSTAGEKMKVVWQNLKEQVGTALLPQLDKLEVFLASKVIPKVSLFITQMQNGKGAGGEFAGKVKTAFSDIKDYVSDVYKVTKKFVDVFDSLPAGLKKTLVVGAGVGFVASKIPGAKLGTKIVADVATKTLSNAAKDPLGVRVFVTNPGFGNGRPGKNGPSISAPTDVPKTRAQAERDAYAARQKGINRYKGGPGPAGYSPYLLPLLTAGDAGPEMLTKPQKIQKTDTLAALNYLQKQSGAPDPNRGGLYRGDKTDSVLTKMLGSDPQRALALIRQAAAIAGQSQKDFLKLYPATNARVKAIDAEQSTQKSLYDILLKTSGVRQRQVSDLERFRAVMAKFPPEVAVAITTPGFKPTSANIDALQKKYDLTPRQLKTLVKLEGGPAAIKAADRVDARLTRLAHKTYTAYVNMVDTLQTGPLADLFPQGPKKGKGANAAGTPSWRGGMTRVGEDGPEDVWLPRGARVDANYRTKMNDKPAGNTYHTTVVADDPWGWKQKMDHMARAEALGGADFR